MIVFHRSIRALPALLSVALLVTGSCKKTDHESDDVPAAIPKAPVEAAARAKTIPTWQPQKPEFKAIAERLRKSRNKYVGYLQIDDLNERLEQLEVSDENVEQLFELHRRLGWEYARVGQIDRALEEARMVMQATQKTLVLRDKTPLALSLYGVVNLRKAELENCVARHNSERCLFPLRGGGVYEVREAAEEARRTFSYYLELKPLDLHARWLLNLLHMALGDYPDGVPAIHRIPKRVFESDYDIGRFVNIAAPLGVDAFNCCGGCAVDDFDNDGFLDIVTSTWDPDGPMTFYRNLGSGRFEDRSAASRLDDQYGGLNLNTADYDNDGRLDILVLRGSWLKEDGRIRNSLLHNNGDGTFTDVTRSAGLAEPAFPAHSGAWGDFDNDGDLDVYIGNESRVENEPIADYPSQLFMNNGNGTFTDVAPAAGVTNDRYAKGVAAGDYDNDGDLDLYVSNIGVNRLYRNNGDGSFTDVARQAGVTEPKTYSFACWFFDYDNDGWLDLFVAAYDAILADVAADYLGLPYQATAPCLYRNNGDGTFTNVTNRVGLKHAWMPMGANFGDLDNDGFLDFYLGTGNPQYQSLVPNIMMRNNGGKDFQDVTVSGGFGHLQKGHGIGFADLDNDGDQDIYHQLGGMIPGDKFNNALFQNPGHGNHFLYIRLIGKETNRSGFGARIKLTLETPEGTREVHRAVGMVSSFGGSTLRQEIGLGDATAVRALEIWWPTSQSRQRFKAVELDTMIQVTEGAAHFERIDLKKVSFTP